MHIDKDGRVSGLMEHYLGLFDTLAKAPPSEMEDEVRVWFAQFDKYTWEDEDDFIADFPELGTNFGLLASDCTNEGLCSAFVITAFGVIAEGMLDDLRVLRGLGYFDGGRLNGIA